MSKPFCKIGGGNYQFTSLIIFSLVFFDILSVYLGYRLSIVPRLLLIFSCLVGVLSLGIKVSDLKVICCLLAVVIIQQCASYMILPNMPVTAVIENFGIIIKIFSFPVVLLWIEKLNTKQLLSLKKIIYFSIIVYCISIVISPLLGWSSLHTYGETGRFGYKGIINAGNETAMVLLIACFWTGANYLQEKSFFSLLTFFLMILASLMLGTKGGMLIAITSLLGVFVVNFNKVKLYHKIFLGILIFSLTLYLARWFWDVLYPMLEVSYHYFTSKLTSTSFYGYFNLLISGRDTKLISIISQLEIANYLHLLLGGWPVSLFMVEMDYFDVILLFGLPLGSLIFYFYFYLVFSRLPKTAMHSLFIVIMVIITFLAGHVVLSMLHAPLLAAYIVLSNNRENRLLY